MQVCQPGDAPTARSSRAEQTARLLEQAAEVDDKAERAQLLEEVVVLNMVMADAVVARYRSRGVPLEDLRQVAYLALTKAAQRFDLARLGEGDFASYAVPTIRGEVRRYFRDRAWVVRPPRRIQELQPIVAAANEELWRELGRSARPREIAAHIGESEETVIEALSTDGCFRPASLDRPIGVDDATPLADILPLDDDDRDRTEARVLLQPAVRKLSERDQRILKLRFFDGLTQREIADEVGVTQMQVSRLLTRIFRDMRRTIGESGSPVPPGRS
jgi:RNA polymerase sigma-B factor